MDAQMLEWIKNLLDPANLLTETIYNVTFEILATYVFVRISLGKILDKKIKEYLKSEKDNK